MSIQNNIQAQENSTSKEFWRKYFDLLTEKDLSSIILPEVNRENEREYTDKFPLKLSQDIYGLVKGSDKRLLYFLSSILAIVIRKYSRKEIIAFSTPNIGRQDTRELNRYLFFVHRIESSDTFKRLLLDITSNYKSILENIDYPLAELLSESEQKSVRGYYLELENLNTEQYSAPLDSHFELYFNRDEATNQIALNIRYKDGNYTNNYVKTIFNAFIHTIETVLYDIELVIDNISLFSFETQNKLVNKFSGDIKYPNKTIHEAFEEIVTRFPNNIALTFNDKNLTYEELNRKSNQLAWYLKKNGFKAETIVGLLVEPSFETIISILAVLKAGGAYLPIDSSYPFNRINEIVKDSRVEVLVTINKIISSFPSELSEQLQIIALDEINLSPESVVNPPQTGTITDLAYVIYTSGSTGTPKGAMVEHQNVIRLFFNDQFQFSFSEHDIWTMFHRYCFDFSVWEMYGALLYGGRLIIVQTEDTRNPKSIVEIVSKYQVTVLNQTPTAFYNFLSHALNIEDLTFSLRYIIFGGEALKPLMLKEWYHKYPDVKLINMYGITETTVHVTYKQIGTFEIENNVSNIGFAIPTLRNLVVDIDGKALPVNFPGELWVAGDGVCRGYLNNERLTQGKFIEDSSIFKGRIYKSGDLVQILESGELEYLGRIDNQIKVRGHRIEVDEIIKKINEVEAVTANIILYNQAKADDQYLSCYFIADVKYSSDKLRNILQDRLPEYMIPRYFIQLDSFPLTLNGKIDITALPEPIAEYEGMVLPGNHTEKVLYDIWQTVLNLKDFGIHNTFFELGGDSIKVLKLLYIINERFNVNLDVNIFYKNYTICELSKVIDNMPIQEYLEVDEAVIRDIEEIKYKIYKDIPKLKDIVEDIYPMTDIQIGMVYNTLKSEDTRTIYSDQKVHFFKIDNFDLPAFKHSLMKMLEDNEILRTAFNLTDYDIPLQLLYKKACIDYEHFDITTINESEKIKLISEELEKNKRRSFDFSQPCLLRVRTFLFDTDKIVLMNHVHHSIMDGWSYAIFLKELWATYSCIIENAIIPPKVPSFRQKEFVLLELTAKNRTDIRDFWMKELKDIGELIPYPQRLNDLKPKHYKYESIQDIAKYNEVKSLADRLGVSVKAIFFAAYMYLISRLSNNSRVVVGLTTTTRPINEHIDKVLGCFLNVVPIIYKIDAEINIEDFIKNVHTKLIEISQYDKLSVFEIEKLIGDRSKRSFIIGNYFTFNDFEVIKEERNKVFEPIDISKSDMIRSLGTEHSDIPFQITINKGNNRVRYIVESTNNYLEDFLCKKVGDIYATILDQFITKCFISLSSLEVVSLTEQKVLLNLFNNTNYDFKCQKSVLDYFEEKVASSPDEVAVMDFYSKISYKELNEKSNQLALRLLQGCNNEDCVVGLMLDRSIELLIGIIGILKAGMVYLPILPNLPEERVLQMLKNSGCSLIVTTQDTPRYSSYKTIFINDTFLENDKGFLKIPRKYTDLAYIIFTSGTTGQPKGAAIEHGALMNRLLWMVKHYQISSADTILHKTPISFDVSIWELFLWMISGSKLCLLKIGKEGDPREIAEAIQINSVSIIHFVPTMLKPFLRYIDYLETGRELKSLRLVVSSGEALTPDIVTQFYKKIPYSQLSNLYGPTEATIDVTYYDCEEISKLTSNSVPIGKPIDNIKILILNEALKLQPIGVLGELYIVGRGLARGYINNKSQSDSKFIMSPYYENERMYKTGDLCRWLPDGNIEYSSRGDSQVKIRGVRIELEEILYIVKKHPLIIDAVVDVFEDEAAKEKVLCLYYVSKAFLDISQLKLFLKKSLIDSMIPTHFIGVSSFPVTLNGKLDKKSLPKPEISFNNTHFLAPRNSAEVELAKIWSDVLSLELNNISVYHNFFDLGGHSINALRVQRNILNKFKVNVTIAELFNNPTINELSFLLESERPPTKRRLTIPKSNDKPLYVLSHQQNRLFFLQELFPDSVMYNIPLLLKFRKFEDIDLICRSLSRVVERHSILRTTYAIIEGVVYQKITNPNELILETVELETDRPIENQVLDFISPFKLTEEPSYRIKFFKYDDELYLFIDIHHIAIDGFGLMSLFSDFYKIIHNEQPLKLDIDYTDYCEWLASEEGILMLNKEESFWFNEFKGYEPVSSLPYDNTTRSLNVEARTKTISFGDEILNPIKDFLKTSNCSIFMFLVTLYNILLYKVSGNRRNIVGSPVSARCCEELQNIVGMFANTVAIQVELVDSWTFSEALHHVRIKLLSIYDNQSYPFEALVDKLKIKREYGRNPLFDTCLILQNPDLNSVQPGNKRFEVLNVKSNSTKFDLSLICSEVDNFLTITFEYDASLFEDKTIERLIKGFGNLLTEINLNPAVRISHLMELKIEDEF